MGKNTRIKAGDKRKKSVAGYKSKKKAAQCKIPIIYG